MKSLLTGLLIILATTTCSQTERNQHYPTSQEPLVRTAFVPLPLGAVKPAGWLKDQLVIQAAGLTGHLDEFWPSIQESAWKGGPGEAWERGPYYLDGLVPLAYLLEDTRLIAKTQEWIEWILASGRSDGWFGPAANADRWPLAVAMKVLTQYHEATGDERVIPLLTSYFTYLKNEPPDWPDSEWRGVRAKENLVSAFWLYKRRANADILEAAQSIIASSYDWSDYFLQFPWDTNALNEHRIPHEWDAPGLTSHVVNVAMAVKYPGLRYLFTGDEAYRKRVFEGLAKLDTHHGQATGRFSGDEHLSGRRPTQGTEYCAVVELLFSLENLLEISGEPVLSDRMELLAYNAIPGSTMPDFWAHQYDQQSNQVLCSIAERDWSSNGDQSNIYGLEPNYGCCTSNMHQGWPKFISHMWMATHDQGLAAMVYGPSSVSGLVGSGEQVTIAEDTQYPFDGAISFSISVENPVWFPLYLRIPGWAVGASVMVGGEIISPEAGTYTVIERRWRSGDKIELQLPMSIRAESRHRGAIAIMRGPLYFSLKIGERMEQLKYNALKSSDWAVHPTTSWNYGLLVDPAKTESFFSLETRTIAPNIWAQENAPVVLKGRGRIIPEWQIVHNSAGEIPAHPAVSEEPLADIELIPYGSTRLRVTEFPVIDTNK